MPLYEMNIGTFFSRCTEMNLTKHGSTAAVEKYFRSSMCYPYRDVKVCNSLLKCWTSKFLSIFSNLQKNSIEIPRSYTPYWTWTIDIELYNYFSLSMTWTCTQICLFIHGVGCQVDHQPSSTIDPQWAALTHPRGSKQVLWSGKTKGS